MAGEDGPEAVAIMEFDDEAAVRAAFNSPEYVAAIPDRDKSFERFNIILAAAPPQPDQHTPSPTPGSATAHPAR